MAKNTVFTKMSNTAMTKGNVLYASKTRKGV